MRTKGDALLWLAAFILGMAADGRLADRRARSVSTTDAPPYFKPGRYRVEAADGSSCLYLTFDSNWTVDPW
ncbi:MAG TPA: hypothetical protein VLT58_01270 [Polyangia bacterium]|nr:hypothetical protein [Polyangia bacterium]